MKKLLAVLCAFGLILAVGVSTPGCGKKSPTPTTTSPASSPATTTKTTT